MSRKRTRTKEPGKKPSKMKAEAASKVTKDDRTPEQKLADRIRTAAGRETIEAFVVAFVLALLFRAFVAEAFVIPTGSMAPTLMGAHKDVTCDQCSHNFQIGASKERRGPRESETVVAGICPNCHYLNNLDLVNEVNDATFNGDRILVSKFSYALSEPKRWDVIVFKFPGNPKQNYIKRLVGLPGETLGIKYGDVYLRPKNGEGRDTILRKPADKLLAMRHHVYDTDKQSDLLIRSGYPSRIQPWRQGATAPPEDSWKVDRSKDGLTATIEPTDKETEHWLRYFHRYPSLRQWAAAEDGDSLAHVDPYSSGAVSDYYAYDCYITTLSTDVYRQPPLNSGWARGGVLSPGYQPSEGLQQFGRHVKFGEQTNAEHGSHWVGDLFFETSLTVDENCDSLTMEIVESGVQFQCVVDLQTGKAKLQILEEGRSHSFTDEQGQSIENPEAATALTAGGSYQIRFSNCDDQLLLWVNQKLVEFSGPTTFRFDDIRSDAENRPYYRAGDHPLDAAPVGLAVQGGKATVDQIRIDRDKYYCSTKSSWGIYDYDPSEYYNLTGQTFDLRLFPEVFQTPEVWAEFQGWKTRRRTTFVLEEDQFFPMGDNSPESLDARCWAGAKVGNRLPERFEDQAYRFSDASYVPRDLLVGKALVVFWPHSWNAPVPFTPNFSKFRLIR